MATSKSPPVKRSKSVAAKSAASSKKAAPAPAKKRTVKPAAIADAPLAPETPVRELPNAVTEALAKNVKRYRIAADLSQMELAFRCEIERAHVSRLERGTSNPTLLTLATLCHVLGIHLPDLFDGITETQAPTWQGGPIRRINQSSLDKPPAKGSRRSPLR